VALNNGHQFHIAAILFRGKYIVKVGTNSTKTHPKFVRVYNNGEIGYHLHAEMDVLRVSKPGDIITVIRWNALGNITMAKPCSHCMEFIRDAGIKKVIYSEWNSTFKAIKI
jgi:deoxycytidylate deaminase